MSTKITKNEKLMKTIKKVTIFGAYLLLLYSLEGRKTIVINNNYIIKMEGK